MSIPSPKWSSALRTLLVSATGTALAAGPIGGFLAERGRLDIPNHRSSHFTPVPRGGGLAGLVGATAAVAASGSRPPAAQGASVGLLAALGWADDVSGHVPVPIRLACQLAVGALGLSGGSWDRITGSIVTSGVVNVVNFMDGINGISGLTGFVWGVNAMVLHDEGAGELAQLGALTAGASLGFLPHNVPDARLFLGDVGSYALGTAMAAGILSQRSIGSRYRVGAPLVLYAADAAQALISRARSRLRLSEAHREHVYQRLVDEGRPHCHVALLHAAGAATIAVVSRRKPSISVPVTGAIVIAYLCLPRERRMSDDAPLAKEPGA